MNTTITLSITHTKPLPEGFQDMAAGRIYSIQGVEDVTVIGNCISLPVRTELQSDLAEYCAAAIRARKDAP